MAEFTIFAPEDEDKETIKADVSAGYDVMLDDLEGNYDSREKLEADVCRVIETTVFQHIQERNGGPEVHKVIAELMEALDQKGTVDLEKTVEQSIHQVKQMSE